MGLKREKRGGIGTWAVVLPCLIFLAGITGSLVWRFVIIPREEWKDYLLKRNHGYGETQSIAYEESARALVNPNRGFYHMYTYDISEDDSKTIAMITGKLRQEEEESLALIEINLKAYREGDISREGLVNLEDLFRAMETVDKQLIIRFLYDWNGENMENEPDSLEVVLRHIRQVGPILSERREQIFQLQGLFVGNWGEMHGTKFLSEADLQDLAQQIYQVTDGSIYMSVRMPMQWRLITGLKDPSKVIRGDRTLASRIGLFNDGMLGNESDYGTYMDTVGNTGSSSSGWSRQDELQFQDILCRAVPIGGEVINDNSYNDLKNALRDFRFMHVTYLNSGYDSKVLNKWRRSVIHEESCFDGMDGLSYVERHLGYRLVLREAELVYDWKSDMLDVYVTIQNVGFAPLYREVSPKLMLYSADSGEEYLCTFDREEDIRELAGGTQAQETQTLHFRAPMEGMPEGELKAYFSIIDENGKRQILLGNTQDPEEGRGYPIGFLSLGSLDELEDAYGQITR